MQQGATYGGGNPLSTTLSQTNNANPFERWVNFTGKTVNATNASRTRLTAAPPVGGAVCMDPYGWDTGRGGDFTKPYTATFGNIKGIILDRSPSVVNGIVVDSSGTLEYSGQILVAFRMDAVDALVDGTTDVAVNDVLTVVNDSYNLVLGAAYPSAANSVANWIAMLGAIGLSLAARTTNSAALSPVQLRL